jgi:CRISPR-associated DxTHG motif protein
MVDVPDRPDRVLAMVTEKANDTTWPVFQQGVREAVGLEPESIPIPDGRNAQEVRQIVEALASQIPERAEVTLDVTQGFRHFPFILYALGLYLQSLRGVRIHAAYYGMLEGASDPSQPRPIIDLQPLLELPEWFYAVRVFKETGSTSAIARLANRLAAQFQEQAVDQGNDPARHRTASEARQFAERLEQVGFATAAGLPLELGKASTLLLANQSIIPDTLIASLPLGSEISQQLTATIEPFRYPVPPTWKNWKRKVDLSQQELERQAVLIDRSLAEGAAACSSRRRAHAPECSIRR